MGVIITSIAFAMFGLSAVGAPAASALGGASYNARASWLPSDASLATQAPGCHSRQIDLDAGTYLYRNFDRNLRYTSSGAYRHTFAQDKGYYLAAGRYQWTDCMYLAVPGGTAPCWPNCDEEWVHDSALTRLSTGGQVRNDTRFYTRGGYQHIEEWGSALYRCSASTEC